MTQPTILGEVRKAAAVALGDRFVKTGRGYNDFVGRRTQPDQRSIKVQYFVNKINDDYDVAEEVAEEQSNTLRRSLAQRLSQFNLRVGRTVVVSPAERHWNPFGDDVFWGNIYITLEYANQD